MDAAKINAKIYAGRGKAALRLGFDYDLYRPTSNFQPLDNSILTLKAAFNAADNNYRKPNLYNKPIWFGDFDGRLTQPGDYLAYGMQVFFIAAQQSLLPIVCIECNRAVTVISGSSSDGSSSPPTSGIQPYSGLCADSETPELGNAGSAQLQDTNIQTFDSKFGGRWPCSILLGGREQNSTVTPTSIKQEGWIILLPPSITMVINSGDIVVDDLGRRYEVIGAELTDMGWRIKSYEAHA
jgi:hypothetical protein